MDGIGPAGLREENVCKRPGGEAEKILELSGTFTSASLRLAEYWDHPGLFTIPRA